MSVSDQAVRISVKDGKPSEEKKKATCPCEPFLQCCLRTPYGKSVWANPFKSKIACKTIAYDGESVIEDTADYAAAFQNKLNSKAARQNRFFKTLKEVASPTDVVMYFPELTMAEYQKEMALLLNEVTNAAYFTDFQRSIILRANMAKNKLKKLTEDNVEGSGKLTDVQLDIYGKAEPLNNKYNIDHIKVRAKGGCSRFCNAALLGNTKNGSKNDTLLGCPCVCSLKSGEAVGNRQEFDYTPPKKRKKKKGKKEYYGDKYTLYECQTFADDREASAKNRPAKPLGTMEHYKDLCNLDDPKKFIPRKMSSVRKEAKQICKSGK